MRMPDDRAEGEEPVAEGYRANTNPLDPELAWLLASIENAPRYVRRRRLREYLTRAQAHRCYYCAAPITTDAKAVNGFVRLSTLDHKLPQGRGGTDVIENLAAACEACNNAKGDLTVEEFIALRVAGLR